MSKYLFTYGTLQPGMAPREIAPVVERLRMVGEGSARGTLYDLGAYPGVVLDALSEHRVYGTVFELPEDDSVLRQLDTYEDYHPGSLESSLFVRAVSSVELVSGGALDCWMYVYNRRTDGACVVVTGRFRR
jgi:gamma-glutamylcyclotransferase (GGCT)/AIG2-like uncharacterized protein YtfP